MKHSVAQLVDFASRLLQAGGMQASHATQVAETLMLADCFGHSTHGLALLPRYIGDLARGVMAREGEVSLVRDGRSVLLFDANLLPGPVAIHHALDLGLERVGQHGTVSMVIRNSAHTACLAAYLERATARNVVMLLVSSNPSVSMVVPHGGMRPVLSPNPLAFGFPTMGDPVLVDVSMSAVAANSCRQAMRRGEKLSGAYLRRPDGEATDDPSALFATPAASLMPLGGVDLGHKGYGLGLMVEMLTSGFAGTGRSTEGTVLSNTSFIYLADPDAFGGNEHLTREGSWLVDACRAAGDGGDVRLPGERALARRREALIDGLSLPDTLLSELNTRAGELGVAGLQEKD